MSRRITMRATAIDAEASVSAVDSSLASEEAAAKAS